MLLLRPTLYRRLPVSWLCLLPLAADRASQPAWAFRLAPTAITGLWLTSLRYGGASSSSFGSAFVGRQRPGGPSPFRLAAAARGHKSRRPPPPPPSGGSVPPQPANHDPNAAGGGNDEVEKRKRTLAGAFGNKTVRELYEEYFNAHGIDAIQTLAHAIGARPLRIQWYYRKGEDVATRQKWAMPALEYLCQCEFRTAVISTEALLESFQPLLMPLQGEHIGDGGAVDGSIDHAVAEDRTMDLSFLDPLRAKGKEGFLAARRIYVRDSMREVFGCFREDALQDLRPPPDMARSASLVGFPGVGKSTLFFLAAIDQARTSNVVYYRRVEAEPISVFVMTPHNGSSGSSKDGTEGGVRVWYARDVCGVSLGAEGLTALHRALIKAGVVDRSTYYAFVDGPQPKDATNLLHSQYDYLCLTTYDFPARDENGEPNKRLWIMDGWSDKEEDSFLDWLTQTRGGLTSPSGGQHESKDGDGDPTITKARTKESGRRRYFGGNIRVMRAAYERASRAQNDSPERPSVDGGDSM